jgi:protein TonB
MQDRYDGGAHGDRFVFALLVAMVLHAALILGVGFTAPDAPAPATSLDVTLAPFRSDTAPEEADFLAPTHQQGGGEAARPAEAASPVASNFNAAVVREVLHEAGGAPGATPAAEDVLRSLASPGQRVVPTDPEARPAEQAGEAVAPGTNELASLIARLREQSRAYAHRPRVERMTSVSARAAEDAGYLLGWTERIETVGNINYPEEARRRRLYGDLRLLVAVRPDGSVAEVRVLQSSGQPVLDAAAVRIVHMATPFAAFPPQMRARTDLLEIIRTWRFRADRLRTGE